MEGNGGNDTLDGGNDNDILVGGSGNDTFRFTTALDGSVDQLLDFTSGTDSLQLWRTVFTNLPTGTTLPASAFVVGSAAGDADDRIVYNQTTGALFYDADGSGAGAAVQFAQLQAGTALAASDFVLIG